MLVIVSCAGQGRIRGDLGVLRKIIRGRNAMGDGRETVNNIEVG